MEKRYKLCWTGKQMIEDLKLCLGIIFCCVFVWGPQRFRQILWRESHTRSKVKGGFTTCSWMTLSLDCSIPPPTPSPNICGPLPSSKLRRIQVRANGVTPQLVYFVVCACCDLFLSSIMLCA